MFKTKTLTKLLTEAVSRLIVADIYGGFCRSVFTQFCPGWPLITRTELRKITGIITRRPRHRTKICCFTAPPRGVAWHITVVQITTENEESISLSPVKKHSKYVQCLERDASECVLSPRSICHLWVMGWENGRKSFSYLLNSKLCFHVLRIFSESLISLN